MTTLCHSTHTQPQAFAYIHSVMTEDQYTEPDREEVTRAVLQNFQVRDTAHSHMCTSSKTQAHVTSIVVDFIIGVD